MGGGRFIYDLLLTQCDCCSEADISFVAETESRPIVEYHCPRNRLCRIDRVWRPYFQFAVFCILLCVGGKCNEKQTYRELAFLVRRHNLQKTPSKYSTATQLPRKSSSRSRHGFMYCIDEFINSGVSLTILIRVTTSTWCCKLIWGGIYSRLCVSRQQAAEFWFALCVNRNVNVLCANVKSDVSTGQWDTQFPWKWKYRIKIWRLDRVYVFSRCLIRLIFCEQSFAAVNSVECCWIA